MGPFEIHCRDLRAVPSFPLCIRRRHLGQRHPAGKRSLEKIFPLDERSEEGSGEEHVPDPEKLELLVRYVRRTASYLDSKDAADIIVRQQISWPKVLDV